MVCPYCDKVETNVIDSRKTMMESLLGDVGNAQLVKFALQHTKKLKLSW